MRSLLTFLFAILLVPFSAAWAGESVLLMVHSPGCGACAKWEREIGAIYDRTAEAARFPLRRLNIAAARRTTSPALKAPPYFTPTFILVEDGREVGRILGYRDELSFWGLLDIETRKLTVAQPPRN